MVCNARWSLQRAVCGVSPAYELLPPLVSWYQASAAGIAERTFDCAAAFWALPRKLRYDGTAIATRMASSLRAWPTRFPDGSVARLRQCAGMSPDG